MSGPTDSLAKPSAPVTANEWAAWLAAEEEKTRRVYRAKPSLLIADYRRERSITRDYEGRELLELLQNCNDAAEDAGTKGKVVVHLSADHLVVANTGQAFSTEGVESLQTDHLSPKQRSRGVFIGNKGLGFRAILNWSRTPVILSGGLRIAYSHAQLARILEALQASSEEIARLTKSEPVADGELPIAALPFPGYADNGELMPLLEGEYQRAVLRDCERLLQEGYSTAIGMPFDGSHGFENAATQLKDLRPEILLFARAISELRIREGTPERLWSREGGEEVRVLADGVPLGAWRVHRTGGQVPRSSIDFDEPQDLVYEIVVAVPLMECPRKTVLYSYFPTEVTVPLPVVCHATLELAQNRKHLQARRSNGFVLGQLAEFLAEVAERHGAAHRSDPWAACNLIIPSGEFLGELERVGFRERLLGAVKTRAVVPTVGGDVATPAETTLLAGASAAWLPAEAFSDVATVRDARDLSFFRELEIAELEPADFLARIRTLPELDVARRAALIEGILTNDLSGEVHSAELLLDARGEPVPADAKVFLAPTKSGPPPLPTWMELRFLSQPLAEALTTRLAARDARDLQDKLASFGVLEYSLANLVRALVREAGSRAKGHPEQAGQLEDELLRTLFELYLVHPATEPRPEFPQATIQLPTQSGVRAAAHTLYLGEGYQPFGVITQRLYGSWAPDKLVVPPMSLGLQGKKEAIEGFLVWLGAAAWPRSTLEEQPDPAFCQHVLGRLAYPAQFGDYLFNSPSEVARAAIKKAQWIDGLPSILSHADPLAVLAWLALDDRAAHWQRPSADHGELCSRPGQTKSDRTYGGAIPSYIRWTLDHRPWLPLARGGLGRPRDCIAVGRLIEALFPRPAVPPEPRLSEYGLSASDLREGWTRAGVLPGLEFLERDEIYARLLELPERDAGGQSARALYRWLLDSSDVVLGPEKEAFRRFRKDGRMWGRHGASEGYFPVSELRHADVEGLPEELTGRLKLADLPKRVGSDKVERLFGVQPVERAGIRQSVRSSQLAVGASDAAKAFQAAKPFIYALRQSQTAQRQNLQMLKELQLEVCSELIATMQYEGTQFDYDVLPWGWIIAGSKLYVRSDPAEPVVLASDLLADTIGTAIAALFRLGEGGEFARMLLCKEKDRRQLLRRMRGEAGEEDLQSLEAEFAASQLAGPEGPEPGFPVPPVPERVPKLGTGADVSGDTKYKDAGAAPAGGSARVLEVSPEPHIPAEPVVRQPLRVRAVAGDTGGGSSRRVTDWEFCERKAMEFESSGEQSRFPLRVSPVTGYQAPGCDILSFATEGDREDFRKGERRDLGLVARFIEVKGRSDPSALIELKGNELTAAERFGHRFYLYRLYEETLDCFLLTILGDPLREKSALQSVVHVSLDRAQATQRYALSGGLTRGTDQAAASAETHQQQAAVTSEPGPA